MQFSIHPLISIYLFHKTLVVVHRLQSRPISKTNYVQATGDMFIFTLYSTTKKVRLGSEKEK